MYGAMLGESWADISTSSYPAWIGLRKHATRRSLRALGDLSARQTELELDLRTFTGNRTHHHGGARKCHTTAPVDRTELDIAEIIHFPSLSG